MRRYGETQRKREGEGEGSVWERGSGNGMRASERGKVVLEKSREEEGHGKGKGERGHRGRREGWREEENEMDRGDR